MGYQNGPPNPTNQKAPTGSALALEKHGARQQAPLDGLTPTKKDNTSAHYSCETRKVVSYAGQLIPLDPCLALVFGIGKAAIIQQLSFLMSVAKHDESHHFAGRIWVYNTYSQWHIQLPFIKRNTLEDYLTELERQGVVLSTQRGSWNRVKYYTIAYEELDRIVMNDERVQTYLATHENRRMHPTTCDVSTNGGHRKQATNSTTSCKYKENTKTYPKHYAEGVI